MLRLLFLSSMAVTVLFIQACAPQFKPEESCNFVQNSQGQRVSWKGELPVVFYVDSEFPSEYMEALEQAITHWEDKYQRDLFELGGVTNSVKSPKQDSWNVIYWLENWEEDREFEQARTSIYWVGDKIREADIRVNARDFSYFSGQETDPRSVDMVSLMVHELGHALGLGHANQGATVMASTLKNGTLRRHVSDFDLSSLQCEY